MSGKHGLTPDQMEAAHLGREYGRRQREKAEASREKLVQLRLVHTRGEYRTVAMLEKFPERTPDAWIGCCRLLPIDRRLALVHVYMTLDPLGIEIECAHFSPVHILPSVLTRLRLAVPLARLRLIR